MSRLARVPLRAALLLLTAVSLLVGLSILAVTGGAEAAGTGPTTVGHFTCYLASSPATSAAPGFKTGPVYLLNQFSPNGFEVTPGAVGLHCNPATKTINSVTPPQVFQSPDPQAHLLCFTLKAPTQPARTVVATNQFGSAQLVTGAPRFLCAPTWKNVPQQTQIQPPGLDHYVCYQSKYVTDPTTHKPIQPFTPPPGISLQDQFMPATGVPVAVKVPNLLCVPSQKVVLNGVGLPPIPVQHPEAHLVCFATAATTAFTFPSSVSDQNQFGLGQVNISRFSELCVPSFKDVIVGGSTVPPGSATLTAVDPSTNIGLVGATFTATDPGGGTDGNCTTDLTGVCTIGGLQPGPYTFTETQSPSGYTAPGPQTGMVSGANSFFDVFTEVAAG